MKEMTGSSVMTPQMWEKEVKYYTSRYPDLEKAFANYNYETYTKEWTGYAFLLATARIFDVHKLLQKLSQYTRDHEGYVNMLANAKEFLLDPIDLKSIKKETKKESKKTLSVQAGSNTESKNDDNGGSKTIVKAIPAVQATIWAGKEYDVLLIAHEDHTEMIYVDDQVWNDLPTIDQWLDNASEHSIDKIPDLKNAPEYGNLITSFQNGKWQVANKKEFDLMNQKYRLLYNAHNNVETTVIAALFHNNAKDLLVIDRGGYTDMITIDPDLWHNWLLINDWIKEPKQWKGYEIGPKVTNKNLSKESIYGDLVAYYDLEWQIYNEHLLVDRLTFYKDLQ